MSMEHDKMPVLIGAGLAVQREKDATKAKSPIGLLQQATESALADTGQGRAVQAALTSIAVVRFVTDSPEARGFPIGRYSNPGRSLSNALGLQVEKCFYGPTGGNTPQFIINDMATRIAEGEIDMVAISGGETLASLTRAMTQNVDRRKEWNELLDEAPILLGEEKPGSTELETRHGMNFPVNAYPLLENAYRKAKGRDMHSHMQAIGALMAPFTAIAAQNPYSWFPITRTAEELIEANETNRWVGYPYPKYLNSVIRVDQAASVIMTSVKHARELGIADDKLVYLHGGADANEIWNISERRDLHRSYAIHEMGKTALNMAGWSIDEIDYFDLYSCFPIAVEVARDELGIAETHPRPLTVTGGLPYFGGAGNAYTLLSVASMIQKLREKPGSKGMCTGNGWYLTKHSMGLYSTTMPKQAWQRPPVESLQVKIDAGPHSEIIEKPHGMGVIDTYTVIHPAGKPRMAILIGHMVEGGKRFIANIKDDDAALDRLMQEDYIGAQGMLTSDAQGINHFALHE